MTKNAFSALTVLLFLLGFILTAHGSEGEGLFKKQCGGCHGVDGSGGSAYPLRKEGLLVTVDDAYLVSTMRYGRPLSGCPSFEGKLTPDEMMATAAFIRGWQKGPAIEAPGHSVEPADSQRGRDLFAICGACHGLKAEGAMGPPLVDPGFLKSASDAVIRRTIMYGRPGTPMKGFLKGEGGFPLSAEDIDRIISYLRFTQQKPEEGAAPESPPAP